MMISFIQVFFFFFHNKCVIIKCNFNQIIVILITGGRLAGNNISSHYVPNLGQSVFDYIEKHNARTSIFYNFMYMPNTEQPVRE